MRFTVSGVHHLDGGYDLNLAESPFTMRELHWVKQIAGVRLNEFEAASVAGDSDLLVAFVVIALVRNGKISKDAVPAATEMLLDAEAGKLTAEFGEDEENDGLPPAPAPPSVSGTATGSNESATSSSATSNGTGEPSPATIPLPTGPHT